MLLYTVFTSSVAYCQRVDIKTLVASSLSFVLTSLDYLGKIGGTVTNLKRGTRRVMYEEKEGFNQGQVCTKRPFITANG
jgi:hypothetical protein